MLFAAFASVPIFQNARKNTPAFRRFSMAFGVEPVPAVDKLLFLFA